jgi:flavodoxin short chain
MAESIGAGARNAGAGVSVANVKDANVKNALSADVIALGSPAMGAEVIEEDEMEPFVAALESIGLAGKKLVLFGSYDWGDGQWMQDWENRMKKAGSIIVAPCIIAHNAPDATVLAELEGLGKALATA